MTSVWRANRVMTPANIIMLGLGLFALAIGGALLLRRGGSEGAATARRLAGVMAIALGLFLAIFAIGLSGLRSDVNA